MSEAAAPTLGRRGRQALAAVAVIAALVPLSLFLSARYESTGFYGAWKVPYVVYWGFQVFIAMLLVALLAWVLSWVHPRLVLWVGPATRRHVAVVWGSVALIAVAGLVECLALERLLPVAERYQLERLFRQLQPGQTHAEVEMQVRSSRSTQYISGALTRMPVRDTWPGEHLVLAYPGWRRDGIVLQTTPQPAPGQPTNEEFPRRRIVKLWLVVDERVVATK